MAFLIDFGIYMLGGLATLGVLIALAHLCKSDWGKAEVTDPEMVRLLDHVKENGTIATGTRAPDGKITIHGTEPDDGAS